ncbi:Yip1 family protein [Desulfallas thermosapovorans]|uniref:Yip1 domain-containing protein n=1 Tax=Desulfallas thermosapovorans DSM 6562 TaxID=1121431 RepID=A0A5S4ZUF7_9FIRM|nr:Yip1 family protein [Desulfallas thermosapovorans]TYO96529.1 hypothetical protein LX24_00998 [Desulfallas thermosapovorans DSM 6562]
MDNRQTNHEHFRPEDHSAGHVPVDNLAVPGGEPVPRNSGEENVYTAEQKDNIVNNHQDKNNILEIFYGVLFEPARTFAGFAQNPPIGAIVILFVALNLAEALTAIFTTPVYLNRVDLRDLPWGSAGTAQTIMSFAAVAGFLFSVIKWFFMAGLLHLLAALYGGTGRAKSVWAVYGAAALPAVFMIPVQIAAGLLDTGGLFGFTSGLVTLGLYVWGVVLLITGLREVHGFSTGRAVLTVFTPALVLLLMVLVTLIFIGTVASTIMAPFMAPQIF